MVKKNNSPTRTERISMKFLRGKKTYIVAAIMAVHAIAVTGWLNNDWSSAWNELMAAAAFAGLRAGVAGK